ncbi:hypothetical protein TRAPUB_12026 [Trametes pubescens]|uniref:LsmAD domain-containing protein n=1 Tax=Trametes pubescens TaxID=154538 RepID=A0A1M2VV38_TRAPU|nr:hypothetical protein TRAPUB_12026 [Trametes pubescens]
MNSRPPAWGSRPSPSFSPGPANARLPNGNQQPAGAFPPLANGARPSDANPHARILQQISGLTGTTVTISTKTNSRFEGVVQSTSAEGDTQGVTLKDVKEISNPGAPLKEQQFIAVTNIQEWSSGPADAKVPNGAAADSFKTDTDISQKANPRRERELQAWQPEAAEGNAQGATAAPAPGNRDEMTFGAGAAGGSWDQFAVNEKLFGVKAGFDEEAYTTKLDRNAPDFKEKERKAQQIANEIMGTVVNNPHIAEERIMNLSTDGSGVNEEDKYGAVVRSAGAYVPPGARKGGPPTTPPAKADLPKVAINAPDGTTVAAPTTTSTPTTSKVPSPAPGATSATKPADAVPAFRNFVSTEKDRLMKKKQALMKSEMDKRLSDLVSFSKSFKLNKPIPDDLVPILAKDEEKQRLIKEKTVRDSEDQRARSIGVSSTLTAAPVARPLPSAGYTPSGKPVAETTKQMPAAKASASSGGSKTATAPSKPGEKKISMVIQAIPPFKGKRSSPGQPQSAVPSVNGGVKPAASPLSPSAVNRLNVNASSFRPTAKNSSLSPGGSPNPNGTTSTSSPKGKPAEAASPQGPPNPFFGTRLPKRTPPVHIKDDFNPFKNHKVIEAAQVAPTWPFSGKRYMQMFPPIQQQPQQQSPPMAQPGPPPQMPPTTYEEDPAAQAAARGYVYAYPPYGYPGQMQMVQPMMPGMGPPPPGAYMPGPYMQPMHYPMPPPNGMYPSPQMGQMPPPQYMQPPPPGAYPPPPNGSGPRPSMPPTPIPSHAHPYYHHQSPQRTPVSYPMGPQGLTDGYFSITPPVQHAMPYQMMMPPPGPGGVPPHPYDPSGQPPPPVQMGNHA